MKKELQAGAPGGRRLAPLTNLARFGGSARRGYKSQLRRKPFSRMHYGIRYNFDDGRGGFEARFGFIGGPERVHDFFRDMAEKHEKGFTKVVTPAQRRYFARMGSARAGWQGNGGYSKAYGRNMESMAASGERPLFIRETTRSFHTPGREITKPFWRKHRVEARGNIKRNFNAKMAGGRI